MFDLAYVQAFASRHTTGTATLSPESVAVLLVAIDLARERINWDNAGVKVTDAEWDTIDAIVGNLDTELAGAV